LERIARTLKFQKRDIFFACSEVDSNGGAEIFSRKFQRAGAQASRERRRAREPRASPLPRTKKRPPQSNRKDFGGLQKIYIRSVITRGLHCARESPFAKPILNPRIMRPLALWLRLRL
jgi:hypothetical protein